MPEAVPARKGPVARRSAVAARRKDPESRRPRRAAFDALVNANPAMHYVKVHKTATHLGVDYYRYLGYQVVHFEKDNPDSVRFAGGITCQDKEPLTYMDTVLMGIPIEDWKDIVQNGHDGQGGQRQADKIEDRIIRRDLAGMEDPMRGLYKIRELGSRVVNQSRRLEREIERDESEPEADPFSDESEQE